MTIEEMVDLVAEHVPMRGNGEDLAAPIMAALRAGQAMRSGMQYRPHPIDRETIAFVFDEETVIAGMHAWDAATGSVE